MDGIQTGPGGLLSVKRQVSDVLPKKFKGIKFGVQSVQNPLLFEAYLPG